MIYTTEAHQLLWIQNYNYTYFIVKGKSKKFLEQVIYTLV